MRLRMPSRPAMSCAEKARYGFAEGSGARHSTRLALAEAPATGVRSAAERLRAEENMIPGASKPGTRRWKEFTVGLVKAVSDGECSMIPPMYQRAMSERPP